LGNQVSVVVQKQSGIEGPKPDLLRLSGGGLQRSLGRRDFNRWTNRHGKHSYFANA
jgi:hypothetical protein